MEVSQTTKPVLVIGANGFIAGWCIIHLLEAGYQVRYTFRSWSGAASGIFLPEVARIIARPFSPLGYKISTIVFPSWLVRIYERFERLVGENTKELGKKPEFDNRHIKEVLDWTSLPLEKTLIEMGESLIEHGVV